MELADTAAMGDWRTLTLALVKRVQDELRGALGTIEVEMLNSTAVSGPNSIGWLAWHLTRSYDRNITELQHIGQLWIEEGWHARFNRPPDPTDTGFGHSPDEAAAFRSPPAEVVLSYHAAVVSMIGRYLSAAPVEDLSRMVRSPTLGDAATVEARIVGVVNEAMQHLGQIRLLADELRD